MKNCSSDLMKALRDPRESEIKFASSFCMHESIAPAGLQIQLHQCLWVAIRFSDLSQRLLVREYIYTTRTQRFRRIYSFSKQSSTSTFRETSRILHRLYASFLSFLSCRFTFFMYRRGEAWHNRFGK